MGTQLRRLASYVGVAALAVSGLVGGATASSAVDPPPRWTIAVNSGSCAVRAPVVTVKTMFGDGRDTSIGHTSLEHDDKWVHKLVPDGDYTMTLPEVAAGDTEQFHVSFAHDPLGDKTVHYPGPYSFSVPAECGGPSLFTARPTPSVTGTPQVGKTLTAQSGTWAPTPDSLTYQWERDGWETIDGSTSPAYTLTEADQGKPIRVIVTAAKAGYVTSTRSSAYTDRIAAAPPAAPPADSFVEAPDPLVTGTARVGSILRASTGSWDPAPAFTFQWFRSGASVAGATSQSYRLTAADLGRRMTVAVTGASAGVAPARRTSAASAAVARGLFSRAPNPRITGRTKVRRTLTAWAGTGSPAPSSVSYRWYRSGVLVRKVTGKTYRLTRRDLRKRVRVVVTAKKSGYASSSRASATTSRVRR